ncbi:MAG: ribosomal protein S18-alanine N-acetyltransferase [Acidobacteriota bacterium]
MKNLNRTEREVRGRTRATDHGATLRWLASGDLVEVLRIERGCFRSPWPRQAFEMAVHDDSILAVGAFDDDAPVGYVIACAGARSVLVANLAVAEGRRRRGLGRRLLDVAVDWARSRGHHRVTLEVRRSNAAAIRLYGDAGFEAVAVRRGYYDDPPEDALTMALDLDDGDGSEPCD